MYTVFHIYFENIQYCYGFENWYFFSEVWLHYCNGHLHKNGKNANVNNLC